MAGRRSASAWNTRASMYMPLPAMIQAITAPIGPVAFAKVRGSEKIPAPTMPPTTIAVRAIRVIFWSDEAISFLPGGVEPGSVRIHGPVRSEDYAMGRRFSESARAGRHRVRTEQGHPRHRRGPHPDAACRRSNGEAIESSGSAKGRPRRTHPACAWRADTRIVGIIVPCPESQSNGEMFPYLPPEVEPRRGSRAAMSSEDRMGRISPASARASWTNATDVRGIRMHAN